MSFRTSDGTLFRVPALSQKNARTMLPVAFMAKILEANNELKWSCFTKKNIQEVITYFTNQLRLSNDPLVPLSAPFGGSHNQVCPLLCQCASIIASHLPLTVDAETMV